jgi:hypothetical protein
VKRKHCSEESSQEPEVKRVAKRNTRKRRTVDPDDPIEAVRVALDEVVHLLFRVLELGGAQMTLHGKPTSIEDVRLHIDRLVSKIKPRANKGDGVRE